MSLSYLNFLLLLVFVALSRESSFTSPPSLLSPIISVTATATSILAPTKLIPACYHHHIPNRAPSALSKPSHRSNSDRVEMYCVTVFLRCQMYSSIVWNPASFLAVAAELYVHFLSVLCRGSRRVICFSTWSWNPPQGPSHTGGDRPGLQAK